MKWHRVIIRCTGFARSKSELCQPIVKSVIVWGCPSCWSCYHYEFAWAVYEVGSWWGAEKCFILAIGARKYNKVFSRDSRFTKGWRPLLKRSPRFGVQEWRFPGLRTQLTSALNVDRTAGWALMDATKISPDSCLTSNLLQLIRGTGRWDDFCSEIHLGISVLFLGFWKFKSPRHTFHATLFRHVSENLSRIFLLSIKLLCWNLGTAQLSE